MAPPKPGQADLRTASHRLNSRQQNLIVQSRLPHDTRHQGQTVSALGGYSMIEAAFASPLRHATGEIHLMTGDSPALVSQLDNHAHGAGTNDAPLAVRNIFD